MKRMSLLLLSCALVACSGRAAAVPSQQTLPLRQIVLRSPAGKAYPQAVELASTPQQRETGLMGRTAVPQGMLFLFEKPQMVNFWMKNTLMPLDIVYFDAQGRFLSQAGMTPCAADPCATYPSGGPVLSALELASGTIRSLGIGTGWTLELR